VRLLRTFSAESLIEIYRSQLGIEISDELTNISQVWLYQCEISGLEFFIPASSEGSELLYSALQKFDWFYMSEKWEFNVAINDLKNSRSILEVGSGVGFFIEKAAKDLKKCNIKGIETNRSAVESAAKRGLPVEDTDLENIRRTGRKFDGICAFQVLEHLAKPREFLQSLSELLERGGRLILSVPNKDGFLRYTGDIALDLPPHHMSRWCAFTFKSLEKILPLRLKRLRFEPLATYHIDWFLMAYLHHFNDGMAFPIFRFSELGRKRIARFLEFTRLHRFMRGHTLYALMERI